MPPLLEGLDESVILMVALAKTGIQKEELKINAIFQ